MNAPSRRELLERMLEQRPGDPRALFGLALEAEREQRWEDVARHLAEYLEAADDEGNAYGRLGRALRELGRDEEAREAYRKGIRAALKHDHPTMAQEFEDELDTW